MFVSKKKFLELEKRAANAERELAGQAEKIKLMQERCERLERRSVTQARDFESKLVELKSALAKFEEIHGKEIGKSRLKEQEDEAATVAQVMDEWLNGKKEGGK